MNFTAAGLSDVGLQREHNEDSFCILSEHRLFVVADGMGGHRAGDIASRMATAEMKAFFEAHKDRLTVFDLPSYSPDYNPIEKLWKKVKEKGTHLQYFPTFEALKEKVEETLAFFENARQEVLSLVQMYRVQA